MSTNFVENAKPKTTTAKSRKTWNFISILKARSGKNRHKRNRGSNRKTVKITKLKKKDRYKEHSVLMKYMFVSWSRDNEPKAFNDQVSMSINHFKTIDSTYSVHCLALDDTKEKTDMIFAKISREVAKRHLAKSENSQLLRGLVDDLMKYKSHVNRGTKCDSVNTGYRIMGFHPDRISADNREYAFNPGVTEEKKKEIEENTNHIVQHLQGSLRSINPFIQYHRSVMMQVVKNTTLDVIGDHAPAFSVGVNYHSRCHIDDDMYFTMATVIAPSTDHDDEIIYYFTFPTFAIKVPLRSGDSLLFNPALPHSCGNPKYKNLCIISAYVSKRTVLRSQEKKYTN